MEETALTHGQFQILLAMTPDPREYTPQVCSLVIALHKARAMGYLWRTKLTEQDVETALGLFRDHQHNVGTSAAKKAWQRFVTNSPTARKLQRASEDETDVPRETKET